MENYPAGVHSLDCYLLKLTGLKPGGGPVAVSDLPMRDTLEVAGFAVYVHMLVGDTSVVQGSSVWTIGNGVDAFIHVCRGCKKSAEISNRRVGVLGLARNGLARVDVRYSIAMASNSLQMAWNYLKRQY